MEPTTPTYIPPPTGGMTAAEITARILLVDDDPIKLLALESALAGPGHVLVTARSAEEALRYLLRYDFAVIVLDVHMPGMNGLDLASLIRRRQRSCRTPIMFVSALSPTERTVRQAYALGAVDYIYVPAPEVLRTKVSVFVDLYKQTETAQHCAAALQHLNTDLEQRVAERTAALQALNAGLEQQVATRTALLAMLHTITAAANEATCPEEALQCAVGQICAYTHWPVGHVYLPTPEDVALWGATDLWHLETPERFAAFQEVTRATSFRAGEGLIGRVIASGQPAWSVDITADLVMPRRAAAVQAGLRSGFAFPILVGTEVVGVLEFYTCALMVPDPALLEAMLQIGAHLGRAIERQRALEQAQRQQEALYQREKLAAMGMLLSNVAHELNNPLAAVMLQAELLREELGSSPLQELVGEISTAAERCKHLVRSFLTLTQRHAPERTVVVLNALITETVELLARALQVDDITVELRLADDLPLLWADGHQLRQVLINLLTNAQQALRDVARPRQVTLTSRYDAARACVLLDVADTGPGMPGRAGARL